MIPVVTLDLREHDFDTMQAFADIAKDLIDGIKADYPEVQIDTLVISEHHLKMLRLEQFMKGMPLEEVKNSGPEVVCGVRVAVDMGGIEE